MYRGLIIIILVAQNSKITPSHKLWSENKLLTCLIHIHPCKLDSCYLKNALGRPTIFRDKKARDTNSK